MESPLCLDFKTVLLSNVNHKAPGKRRALCVNTVYELALFCSSQKPLTQRLHTKQVCLENVNSWLHTLLYITVLCVFSSLNSYISLEGRAFYLIHICLLLGHLTAELGTQKGDVLSTGLCFRQDGVETSLPYRLAV